MIKSHWAALLGIAMLAGIFAGVICHIVLLVVVCILAILVIAALGY